MQYKLSRRELLKASLGITATAFAGDLLHGAVAEEEAPGLHEASFYEKLESNTVRCSLCPWRCVVPPGGRGKCRVRENRNGTYYTLVYGYPCAIHNDPIEKKPFAHVYPGSMTFSLATVGCNFVCKFCQNWEISQKRPEEINVPYIKPADIIKMAKEAQPKPRTVAFTYSEPTIFYEYMADCARAAKDAGLGALMISNGFIAEKPLKELCKVMTAIKVDLKAFTKKFYEEICEGQLEPVLNTLKCLKDSGVWFEIVVLIIPTLNDGADEIKRMTEWIVKELGPDVPVHFSRYHPAYKIQNIPPTPPATLHRAWKIAKEQGCNFAYTGNMPGVDSSNTYCPGCGNLLLKRYAFSVEVNNISDGKCSKCRRVIPGVWN
jgi:pyruvate formate lyase activating enzyme